MAKRYARALLGLSTDAAQLEAWSAELEKIAQVIEAPEIAERLASPEVSHAMRIQVLEKIAERLDLSFPLRSFAVVVARHGRYAELGAIAESYRRLLDDLMGRARATISFAQKPSDAEIAQIVQRLEAISHKKIIATTQIDDSLLGGVVVELEGKIYDGSLATRLAEVQRQMAA